jgi:hypothetical protein
LPSPFDPTTWWPWSARPASDQSWLDTWLELTTWWVQPARELTERSVASNTTTLLVELVAGIARRFESQRFDATVRATPVTGTLVALRLVRAEGVDARIELRDVTIAGLGIELLTAAVPSVGLQVAGEVRLTASQPTVQVRIGVAELLRWLAPRLPPGWSAALDDAGQLWATPPRGDVHLLVDPAVRHGEVELRVRAVRRQSRLLRLPRWLHVTRTFATGLPTGVVLLGGFRSGDVVEAHLELPALDERLDLTQLRDAIARRQVLAIGG